MTSPDILDAGPYNTQAYNRYSYVMNNPMKYVDPSRYQYLSSNKTNPDYYRIHGYLNSGASDIAIEPQDFMAYEMFVFGILARQYDSFWHAGNGGIGLAINHTYKIEKGKVTYELGDGYGIRYSAKVLGIISTKNNTLSVSFSVFNFDRSIV